MKQYLCFLVSVLALAGCNNESSRGHLSGNEPLASNLGGEIHFIDDLFDYHVHDLSSGITRTPYSTNAISQFMSYDKEIHSVVGRHQDRLMVFYEDTKNPLLLIDGHNGYFRGQPEISKDNSHMAILDYGVSTTSHFLIYQLNQSNATLLSSMDQFLGASPDDITSWAWTSNGQLLVGFQKSIYLLEDFSGQYAIRVRDFSPYEVGYMEVSNSGDQVAFTLSSGADAPRYTGTLFVMNVDGSELKQITQEGSGSVASLSWSPDDKYIALIDYFESGATSPYLDVDRCPDVHVVPLNAGTPIGLRERDPSPSIRLYHSMEGASERTEICAKHSLDWRS